MLKNKSNYLVLVLLICLISLLFFAGCVEETTNPSEKLRVAVLPADNSALVLVAQEKGFFAANGLEVELKEYPYGLPTLYALQDDELDIGLPAEFALVGESFNADNYRVIATCPQENVMVIVARKSSGIAKPSDLKGKLIAVTRKTQGEYNLKKFLLVNGISIEDVNLINMSPGESVDAIAKGEVDAMLSWNQNVYNAQKALGENAISWDAQGGQVLYLLHTTTKEKLEANPDAYKKFVKAIVGAADYIKQNPEEAKALVTNRFDIQEEYINSHWARVSFNVTLPRELVIVMEDEANWKIENNLAEATQIPNFMDFIYTDALNEVIPGNVTVQWN